MVAVDLVVTDRIADLVAEDVDLAIRVGPLQDSSLIARAFVSGPSGLFASPSYLDRRGMPTSLADLEQHELIAIRKPWAQPLVLMSGSRQIKLDLSGEIACDDLLTVRALVTMGQGISFLPGYLAQQNRLVRALPELKSPFTGLYLVYPAQKFLPARVSGFIKHAVASVNRAVYDLLRYGVKVKADVGDQTRTVWLIDWAKPEANHFAIAEEVAVKPAGDKSFGKRPDVVIYVNGISLGVLELKR